MTDEEANLSASARKAFDIHGYGFHYAVMRRGEELFQAGQSRWHLVGAEYPVEADTSTHIDFVYGTGLDTSTRTYLVAECKRVDPARGRWCFATAPYTFFDPDNEEVVFDELQCAAGSYGIAHHPRRVRTSRRICHIGRELRSDKAGDGEGGNSKAIDSAVAQVLRGTSGLLGYLRGDSNRFFGEQRCFRFIPVVFTNAEVWTIDVDLGTSDLRTGKLPKDIAVTRHDWIWFVHNRSPAIAPRQPAPTKGTCVSDDLARQLRLEFARSIAIVSSDGIDGFLGQDLAGWLSQ